MKKRLQEYLRKQSFHPDLLSILINPFFFIRSNLKKNIKSLAPELQGRLLDFGCGRKPYEKLFNIQQYIGIDIEHSGHSHENSKVDVFYDGERIPFPNEYFDALFCSEVIEHIFEPEKSLIELNRVLKKDAKIIITVPFAWNEHEVPYDNARFTSFGIAKMLERCGFEILQLKKSGNFARVLWQLWNLYIFEFFKPLGKAGYVLSLLFIAPSNLMGAILLPLFPKNNSLYFNNVILAKKN